MKVLADYHHHDLWESLELLCARLGWTLYRPIGMDWFEQGYWNHERKWHGDAIARQYLEPWGSDLPLLTRLGHGHRLDASHGRYQHIVTLPAARDLRPDIVISTLAHNHEGMARFASEVGATFGLQIGNVRFGAQDMAEDRWDLATFGLVSGRMPVEPPKPHVVYHQEFAVGAYNAPPRLDPFRVASFVQCYPESPTYGALTTLAPDAPEFSWRVYGAYGSAPLDGYAAGNIGVCADVTEAMRASDIAWHAKAWSDGFGHVIHQWFAVGRPVFGFEGYYRDQLAGPLWIDGVTSIDIERRSRDEVLAELRRIREDEDRHLRMCEAAAARFREVVNFDEEEQAIRALFAQVLP
jgi:hypothetical protein